MKFLEYQAKEVFAAAGIPTPQRPCGHDARRGRAPSPKSWAARVVVKAQVPIGGRGKAGGVAVVKSADEAAKRGRSGSCRWTSGVIPSRKCSSKEPQTSRQSFTWASRSTGPGRRPC